MLRLNGNNLGMVQLSSTVSYGVSLSFMVVNWKVKEVLRVVPSEGFFAPLEKHHQKI